MKKKIIYLISLVAPLIIIAIVVSSSNGKKSDLYADLKCPDDYANFDDQIKDFDEFSRLYMENHSGASLGDLMKERVSFYKSHKCTKALERYEVSVSGKADNSEVRKAVIDTVAERNIAALKAEQEAIRSEAFETLRKIFKKANVSILPPESFDYYAVAPQKAGYAVIASSTINDMKIEYVIPRAYRYIGESDKKHWVYEGTALFVNDKEAANSPMHRYVGLARLQTPKLVGDIMLVHSMGSCACGEMTFIVPSGEAVAVTNYSQSYMFDDEVGNAERSFVKNNVLYDESGNILIIGLENPYFEFKGAMPEEQTARVPVLKRLNVTKPNFEIYSNEKMRGLYNNWYRRMNTAIESYKMPKGYDDFPVYSYTNILGFRDQLRRLSE